MKRPFLFLITALTSLLSCQLFSKVEIAEVTVDGESCFRIETGAATYIYQTEAGGFSSILDRDQQDWVQYKDEKNPPFPKGASSVYRGLPNLVYGSNDSGAGHPGFDQCVSFQVDAQTIRSVSKSGKWQWSWRFYDDHADLKMESVDPNHEYWFLYEGPVAGSFEPANQYWGSDALGRNDSFPDYLSTGGKIDHFDWAYFGQEGLARVFYLQQLTPDRAPDIIGYMGDDSNGLRAKDGMIVFGFGRIHDAIPLLNKPLEFRIGFKEMEISSDDEHQSLASDLNTVYNTNPLGFSIRQINSGLVNFWAHMPADIDGDGIADWFFHTNNAYGGGIAYFKGQKERGDWELIEIAKGGPNGEELATGDMELADMDGDGDLDPIVIEHTGEWESSSEPSRLFWYENPSWKPHHIGDAPAFVKDVNLMDLNQDGLTDVAVLTFEKESLSIFRQNADGSFDEANLIHATGLHEGMDAGDLDNDGDMDIATCGYIFYNPGGDMSGEWKAVNLDPKWNAQSGDWSRNATKVVVRDLDKNGLNDVIMSHSERAGFPVVSYHYDSFTKSWKEQVILEELPAAHTLEVYDMDLDGDLDLVTGVNWGRSVNLEQDRGDVLLLLNKGNGKEWTRMKLCDDGIYNGRVIDYDGDGDLDIFRLPHHGADKGYLFENQIRTKQK